MVKDDDRLTTSEVCLNEGPNFYLTFNNLVHHLQAAKMDTERNSNGFENLKTKSMKNLKKKTENWCPKHTQN